MLSQKTSMKKFFKLIFVFSNGIFTAFAGSENFPIGARNTAMGNASATLSDHFSVFSNQAGLGNVENIAVGISTERKFFMNALSQHSLAFALPTGSGTFGLSMSYFGFSSYKENKIGLAFGKKFSENITAGIQIDYLNISIPEYGAKSAFTFEGGLIAKITKELKVGVHLYNPLRLKLTEVFDKVERIPTIIKGGLAYEPSEKVIVAIEAEKDIDQKPIYKAGIEYKVVDKLHLRTGISTNPTMNSFGIGLNLKNLKIDIASTYHYVLGISPGLSLSYVFE